MSDEDEGKKRRHTLAIQDAIVTKGRNPELVVTSPEVRVDPTLHECLQSFAAIAERSSWSIPDPAGGAFPIELASTGVVLYTTLNGRLHRVTIQDLEVTRRKR